MTARRIDPALIEASIGAYADAQQSIEQRGEIYREMLGYVPPRIEARFQVTGALDPKVLDLQERVRAHALYPTCFDQKTVQLMVFGMLLMDLSDAAQTHALAARRAGASWQELQGVINLCYLFRGLSAANRGAEVLAILAQHGQPVSEDGQ